MSPSDPQTDKPTYPEDRHAGTRRFFVILLLLLVLLAMGTCGWYGVQNGWFKSDQPKALETEALPLEPIEQTEYVGAPETDDDAVIAGTLSRLDGSDWLESAPFEGTDEAGRTGTFRIFILSESYAWAFESADMIEDRAGRVPIASLYEGEGVQSRYCAATHVLGLGTASFEGTAAFNRDLSNRRARQLIATLAANAPDCGSDAQPRYLAGSLGEHVKTMECPAYRACAKATRPQRRVLLIGAAAVEPDLDIGQALRSGLAGFDQRNARFFKDFRITDYEHFELLE